MAVIKQNFGEGGSSLTPAGQGQPSLAEVLRDIADDLAAINAALAQLIADYNDGTTPSTATAPTLKTQKG